jgi:hypothetical protein
VNKPRWHDLSFDQWVKLWDFAGFRWVLADALYGLARSKMADVKTRLLATQAINEAIHAGILERDTGYPELLRDVLIECARPAKKVAWWRRRRVARQHAAAREQLLQWSRRRTSTERAGPISRGIGPACELRFERVRIRSGEPRWRSDCAVRSELLSLVVRLVEQRPRTAAHRAARIGTR